ncbi:MAG: FKBP-type peptidyl-prolyl cis-trans isomerase N-terminal domain-containing protein [Nitrospirota bacterium]
MKTNYAVPLGAMIVGGMLLSASVSAGERTVLKTQSDKENYTTGVEFVRSLQKRGGSVNLDLVIQGMKDALTGENIQVSDDGLQTDLAAREQEKTGVQKQQANQPADRNSAPEVPQNKPERSDDPSPSSAAFAKKQEQARKPVQGGGVSGQTSSLPQSVAQRGQDRNALKLRALELRRQSIQQGL